VLSQAARLLALAFKVSDVPLGQPAGVPHEDVADCHDGLPRLDSISRRSANFTG
jgi:hypothetical protein